LINTITSDNYRQKQYNMYAFHHCKPLDHRHGQAPGNEHCTYVPTAVSADVRMKRKSEKQRQRCLEYHVGYLLCSESLFLVRLSCSLDCHRYFTSVCYCLRAKGYLYMCGKDDCMALFGSCLALPLGSLANFPPFLRCSEGRPSSDIALVVSTIFIIRFCP